ncbi:MAG: beta-ketoacyl-[acyl-carrier-protein] synthase family protein [Opitutales bacterium]|nr:beta-ketoacyl-[acyl-carrier-protein] synthase family protein [Opitutales bacterium]
MSSGTDSRVVVSGLGFISSIGNSKQDVTDSLLSLRHGFEKVEFLENPDIPIRLVGSVKGFEVNSPFYQQWKWPDGYTLPKELIRSMPPHGVYAYCALTQALKDADIGAESLREDTRTSLFCASAGSPFLLGHHLSEMRRNRGMRGSPFGVVSTISGTLNFNLGAHFGIRGGNCGFVSACASSTHAIGFAWDQIRMGRVDRVIVIGAEDLNAESVLPFAAMRALSQQSEPRLASCPFDRKRSGFVASGGAVALILESAASANARGASPYGVIDGWFETSDGYNPAIADPEGRGIEFCMRGLLDATSTRVEDITYINAHATSTVQGDPSEARAITRVFSDANAFPWVSSTKALTGHPLSMSGAMETAFCMLAAKDGFIPGAAHLDEPDPTAQSLRFPDTTLRQEVPVILKNSSGFGGSNVSLLIRPWRQ